MFDPGQTHVRADGAFARASELARTADRALAELAVLCAQTSIEDEAGMPAELALVAAGMLGRDARAVLATADVLATMPATCELVSSGTVSFGQAKAIAWEAKDLDRAQRDELDATIARLAPVFRDLDPEALISRVQIASGRLKPRTARADERLADAEFVWVQPDLDGGARLFAQMGQVMAATVLEALDTFGPRPESGSDATPRGHQRAQGLGRVCEMALAGTEALGPSRPRIHLTCDVAGLADAARAEGAGARIDWRLPGRPARLSPELTAMLACDAELVPVLFDGAKPLSYGPAHTTIPDRVRKAVLVRDGGCRWPGHHVPSDWCDVHHTVPGCHDPDTLGSFCRPCHRRIHTQRWTVRALGQGTLEFRRGRQRMESIPRAIPMRT